VGRIGSFELGTAVISTEIKFHQYSPNQRLLFHEHFKDKFSGENISTDINESILMDYDQRVIIEFLFNEGTDAHKITERFATQFGEDDYSLQTV
jgi:hypothetical protein